MTKARSNATAPNAKGTLVVGNGTDASTTLAVASTAGYVLTVDSAEATGLKWAAASSPAYVGFKGRNSGNVTVNNTTFTEWTMNVEDWDTDGFHSTTTNTGRITIPTGKGGKYLVQFGTGWAQEVDGTTKYYRGVIYKNGSATEPYFESTGNGFITQAPWGTQIFDLVAGDYLQLYYWQNNGNSRIVGNSGFFSVTYLGA